MSNQADTETLSFRIGLSGTFWDKRPEFSIAIDDTVIRTEIIDANSDEVVYYEFKAQVAENTTHQLKIILLNKENSDVVKDPPIGEPYQIVNDMLLNIELIEIDGIDIGVLKWNQSKFIPLDSNNPVIDSCVNLGWNGTYTLNFTSPFYLWLLENM